MRRQTVRLCSECGKIRIWLAKMGGINLCDTTVEVSLLPAKTYENRCNMYQQSGRATRKWNLRFMLIETRTHTAGWEHSRIMKRQYLLSASTRKTSAFRQLWALMVYNSYRENHTTLTRLKDNGHFTSNFLGTYSDFDFFELTGERIHADTCDAINFPGWRDIGTSISYRWQPLVSQR